MTSELTRRGFIRWGLAGAALAGCNAGEALSGGGEQTSGSESPLADRVSRAHEPAPRLPLSAPPLGRVRAAVVGVGGMGTVHVVNLLALQRVDLVAVADIVPAHAERAAAWARARGKPRPTLYTRGERDYVRMLDREQLDLVINATPWAWHVPIALAAMERGCHAAIEVPAALTLDDCWALVESAERHARHCVMLENCIYDRNELMVLSMVRAGLLGEIVHAEGGYLHDLRRIKFAPDGEGLWRRRWDTERNANLYPTHGLGPIASLLDIHRGDRFESLVSMSSPARGLREYAEEHLPAGDPRGGEHYVKGDVNVSLLRTERGRTIVLSHDTNLPRPYSRGLVVRGTRGIVECDGERVHIEGRSPEHAWEELARYRDEFEHPLWRRELARTGESVGHGGMDFLEIERLVSCLVRGEPVDMNVYDAAALSAVIELSERSVARGGAPERFPDFTRGRWADWPRLELEHQAEAE